MGGPTSNTAAPDLLFSPSTTNGMGDTYLRKRGQVGVVERLTAKQILREEQRRVCFLDSS
jgi:hypothetical protein